MILTLTANPSQDRTVALAGRLERGAVLRAESVLSQAGGKGVNISRAAVAAEVPSVAVLPAPEDDPFVVELLAAGVDCRPVRCSEPVRVNITVTEPDGTTTKLNSPGAEVDSRLLHRIETSLRRRADLASWVVIAGSVPPGTPEDWYANLVAMLGDSAAQVAVDTSGGPLKALAARLGGPAPALPDLLKPNAEELASICDVPTDVLERSPEAVAEAARSLVDAGVGSMLVTLGGHGAVLVDQDGAWHATPPDTTVVSTVGAGDSALFGYLLGTVRGLDAPERLALSVAYGSAAAGLPGTTIPHPSQVNADLVGVRPIAAASQPTQ